MFDDLDKEAQKPVGQIEAQDEEVAMLKRFGELWEQGELLVEAQEEAKHVVIPDDEVAVGLSPAEDLINEALLRFCVFESSSGRSGQASRKELAPRRSPVFLPGEALRPLVATRDRTLC